MTDEVTEVQVTNIEEPKEEDKEQSMSKKIFSWFGKNILDKTVTKDMKFSILKTIMNKLPIPKVEPPKLEDLQYAESQVLYKLRTVLNYCYQVEDNFAATVFTHEKEHLQRYRDLVSNMLNFLIVLCESDSFYRHRMMYLFIMMKSDMLLNHYFRLLNEHGLQETWNGRVLDIRLSPDSYFRDEKSKDSAKEMQGVFSHLATSIAEKTTEQQKL